MHLVFAYNMPHQIPSGELIYSFAALLLSVHPRPRPPKMLIFGPTISPRTSRIGEPFSGLFADRCPRAAVQKPEAQTIAAFAGLDGRASA